MNVYAEIRRNRLKTYVILGLFLIFASFIVYLLGKILGLAGFPLFIFSFGISLVMSFASYYFSDSIVLKLHGAHEASRREYFDLYTVTENLSIAAGIPKPKIYVIDDPSPNAFATGRNYNHAVVVVTYGLLKILDRRELEGVVAHELSHIKNYDILLMTVVSVLVGFLVYVTDFFMRSLWFRSSSSDDRRGSMVLVVLAVIAAILTPILATMLQLAISRKREFLADASAAYLTRYPKGLASALEKISQSPVKLSTANNGTAHLFIENPYGVDKTRKISWWVRIFSTHPPVEDRIAKLMSM